MDIFSAVSPPADHRIHYGPDAFQFGDLRLPVSEAKRRVPLVVFVHGGWWKSVYDLEHVGHLCAALKAAGVATWSIEYRRVGSTGGGWPMTFQDVAAGCDYVAMLAKGYPLDLNRVIAMGHSAGGHLAFWLAGRQHVPEMSPIDSPRPKVALRGVIALAGAVDLRLTCDLSGYLTFAHDKHEVYNLMGGSPAEFGDRYRAGNPGDLLPLGVPQVLIQGSEDDQIPPELPGRWAEMARRQGDIVEVVMIPSADHFDVIDPQSKAWATVQAAVLKMVDG
jgi:acetyl esterase/lipase